MTVKRSRRGWAKRHAHQETRIKALSTLPASMSRTQSTRFTPARRLTEVWHLTRTKVRPNKLHETCNHCSRRSKCQSRRHHKTLVSRFTRKLEWRRSTTKCRTPNNNSCLIRTALAKLYKLICNRQLIHLIKEGRRNKGTSWTCTS